MPRTQIASHRGGAYLWPENSMLAFRQALALRAEQLELDVHLSADGEVVVMHDATLDRMTDGSGPVVAQDWASLRKLRIRGTGGEGIPLLRDALAALAPTPQRLRLEVKADADGRPYPGIIGRILPLLDAPGLRDRIVLMSFQAATVAEAAAAGGFADTVLLVESRPWRGLQLDATVALCRACGATEIGLNINDLDAAAVQGFRAAGLGVGAWGANHAPTIHHAYALDLDVIATDDPLLALRLRR